MKKFIHFITCWFLFPSFCTITVRNNNTIFAAVEIKYFLCAWTWIFLLFHNKLKTVFNEQYFNDSSRSTHCINSCKVTFQMVIETGLFCTLIKEQNIMFPRCLLTSWTCLFRVLRYPIELARSALSWWPWGVWHSNQLNNVTYSWIRLPGNNSSSWSLKIVSLHKTFTNTKNIY